MVLAGNGMRERKTHIETVGAVLTRVRQPPGAEVSSRPSFRATAERCVGTIG